MKKLSILLIGLFLVGCGKTEKITETRIVGAESSSNIEGYYSLPDGGYIEIVKLDNGSHVFVGTQRVLSKNQDDGLALLPQLPTTSHYLKNGAMVGTINLSYNATTNDLEVDGSTTDISGARSTYYEVSLNNSGKLEIRFIIYSASGLAIEVERTVTSL